MRFGRWSWGYIPVAVVLGLIWYEFWQAGAFAPPAKREGGAAARVATGPGVPLAVTPDVPAGPGKAEPERAGKVELDEAFLRNPPPISLAVTDATLEETGAALREALGAEASLQVRNGSSRTGRTFTVNAKNVPFWEVFKELNAQWAIDLSSNQDGLVMNAGGKGVYRFESNGSAILIPLSIAYSRQGSGQGKAGEAYESRYELRVGAAVDPRVHVTGYAPVEALEAEDENGPMSRITPTGAGTFNTNATNYWETPLAFNAPEVRGKRARLKCQVRFLAQLTESRVTVEDAASKVGQSFALGGKGMRLGRFEVQGNSLYTQIVADNPQGRVAITYEVTDANGKTLRLQGPSGTTRTTAISGFQGPFKLTLRAPDEVREIAVAFELKDIPLP